MNCDSQVDLLISLNKLVKMYEQSQDPNINMANQVLKIIDLFKKQDNLYENEMKIFYKIMQKMIFCEQHEIISAYAKIKKSYDKKEKGEKFNDYPPYFYCTEVFKNEQVIAQVKLDEERKVFQNQFKKDQNELTTLRNEISNKTLFYESTIQSMAEKHKQAIQILESQNAQLLEMNKQHLIDLANNEEKLNTLNNKISTGKETILQKDILIQTIQDQSRMVSGQLESTQNEVLKLSEQLEQVQKRLQEEIQEKRSMTPRPDFENFDELFTQINFTPSSEFKENSTTAQKLEAVNTFIVDYLDHEQEEHQRELLAKKKKKNTNLVGLSPNPSLRRSSIQTKVLSQFSGVNINTQGTESPSPTKTKVQRRQSSLVTLQSIGPQGVINSQKEEAKSNSPIKRKQSLLNGSRNTVIGLQSIQKIGSNIKSDRNVNSPDKFQRQQSVEVISQIVQDMQLKSEEDKNNSISVHSSQQTGQQGHITIVEEDDLEHEKD